MQNFTRFSSLELSLHSSLLLKDTIILTLNLCRMDSEEQEIWKIEVVCIVTGILIFLFWKFIDFFFGFLYFLVSRKFVHLTYAVSV